MNKINVLTKEISELIAAGEVIERPSSVVKELVENSIDAGASLITVEIKNGGISYIRITDNGCGISREDIPLAFLRHATSKIITIEDLDSILTLGFRGEALASISAVSKVDVITKRVYDEYGTHYTIEGCEEKLIENCGCPNGTTIVIKDIFYNVPARLKFMKKPVTEGNAISAVVFKLALSHPGVSFKFIRDNKQELLTAGDGKLYSAVYSVFGRDFASSLIPVDYEYNGIKVKGFTVKPLLAKANRSFQNFFINERYVKSITCTVSLDEAYRNCIMTGKFPACVLNIQIPPSIVDVNVHPAKIEVRFSNEKLVFDSVYFAVKNALLENDTPTELKIEEKPFFSKRELFDVKVVTPEPQQLSISSGMRMESNHTPYLEKQSPVGDEAQPGEFTPVFDSGKIISGCAEKVRSDTFDGFKYINNESIIKKAETAPEPVCDMLRPEIRIIGEAFSTYIISQVEDELIFVDKHAAHERILFEKLKEQKEINSIQLLLEPERVLLSHEEYDALIENSERAEELGFRYEEGIPPEIEIVGIPSVAHAFDITEIISELAENFIRCRHDPSIDLFDELYHSIACKSAIKANDKTNQAEMKALIEKIVNDERIRYCPHGRPVMIKLSKKDIEKQFRRVL
ncbi:MAG: DNA mismatch repair endonuclease MutL [Oscillospiraceae bacterium]|jgi:DNA mismatch repair protein MutL